MTGTMTVTTTSEIQFVTAFPGFPHARTWALAPMGDDPASPFSLLRSSDIDGLEFVVVPPFLFFPDYEPELDQATVSALDLQAPADAMVYVVLTLGASIEQTTANLLGPVVVNMRNGFASQAVLHQPGLSTKVPLVPAA